MLARGKEAFIARYTCLGCGKKPQTPHERKDLVCDYCSACRWEAKHEALAVQIEMDGEAACAWAAGLLQREDWAIVDLETTSLSGAIVEIAVVDREGNRYGLTHSKHTWHCLMRKYAKYVGDWSDYWHDYRWYPLPGGNHRAVNDALSALMQRMAARAIGTLETEQEAEKEDAYG